MVRAQPGWSGPVPNLVESKSGWSGLDHFWAAKSPLYNTELPRARICLDIIKKKIRFFALYL